MAGEPLELLRPGLLDGLRIAVVGEGSYGQAVGEMGRRLGAEVSELGVGKEQSEEEQAGEQAVDMLVVDGAGLFATGGLDGCLEAAWMATHTVVNRAFLSAGQALSPEQAADVPLAADVPSAVDTPSTHAPNPSRGGRIVYLAPPPSAGEQADAARAGLENLARTLSIEWARHRITTVTIALGEDTTPGEAAALVAYLASPAGAYFSGCQLDLRGGGGSV